MPYKKVDITGEGTEVVDGGRGTPVDVVQEPTNELEKANTRFIASDKAPKKTVVDSDLQVLGKYYDKDGNELTRSELGDAITADEIDSQSATSGKVLTADGDGGASWESVVGLPNPIEQDINIKYNFEAGESYSINFLDMDNESVIGSLRAYTDGTIECSSNIFSADLIVGNNLSLPIRTFTPVTTGTITKETADDYVKQIVSGKLCLITGQKMEIIRYSPDATVGTTYLCIQSAEIDSTDGSLTLIKKYSYVVNSGGTLDVNNY